MRRPRRTRPYALGAAAVAAGAALALSGPAPAVDETKPYTIGITAGPDANAASPGAEAWAGDVPEVRITLTNLAKTQSIGSANVDIPPGIVLDRPPTLSGPGSATVQGGTIQLRDLAVAPDGGKVTLTVAPRVPCAPSGSYTWTTVAKQANDFNGTGNLFDLTSPQPALAGAGTCTLAFAPDGQPASARKDRNITHEAFRDTGAEPIAVEIRDANPDPDAGLVTWWAQDVLLALDAPPTFADAPALALTGDLTAPAVGGRAQFAADGSGPRINRSYGAYRFTAASGGISAPSPSAAFSIADDGGLCTNGCRGEANHGQTEADLTSPGTAEDAFSLFLGSPDLPVLSCPGYAATNDVVQFDVTKADGSAGTVSKTLAYTILNPVRSQSRYQICFARPLSGGSFPTRGGGTSPQVTLSTGGQAYQGLLPDCARRVTVLNVQQPCISARQKKSGTVILTVLAPAGDPWLRG